MAFVAYHGSAAAARKNSTANDSGSFDTVFFVFQFLAQGVHPQGAVPSSLVTDRSFPEAGSVL